MTLIVRDALLQELNDVAELNVKAFHEYSHALTAENWNIMQTNLSNPAEVVKNGQLIVAEQDHQVVGAVVYCPPGTSDSRIFLPEWASLRMLAVLPQHRGQGIGRQLTMDGIRRAQQDEAKVISLHTSELMTAAKNMYMSLGFKQDLELPSHFGLRYWRYSLSLSD